MNNGTGFIRFQDAKVSQEILEKVEKIQKSPADKVLLDPENLFEISGRQLFLKSALLKTDAKNLHKKEDDTLLRAKLKKGKISFTEIVTLDRENKRNFNLAKRGLYVDEDNITTEDKKESEKRANHFSEKITKMKTPNFKISDTRILLKNINKSLDENFLKTFVKQILEKILPKKEVKNKKLIKNIKILKEDESKGNTSKVS